MIYRTDRQKQVELRHSSRILLPARFERATYGLEGRCSIQLSYGSATKQFNIIAKAQRPSQPLSGRASMTASICSRTSERSSSLVSMTDASSDIVSGE